MRNRTRWPSVLAVVGSAVALTAATPSTNAAPQSVSYHGASDTSKPADPGFLSNIPPDVKAQMLAQAPRSAAAKTVQLSVEKAPNGFAGIALSRDGVDLWWKGTVPVTVRQTVASVSATVPVRVRAAVNSRSDLLAQAARIGKAMRQDRNSSLHTVQIPVDGSRLILVYDRGRKAVSGRTIRTSARLGAATVILASRFRIETVEGPRVYPSGRWDDGVEGTYSGGAAIINKDNGARCTSGFGVKNRAGTKYLLTAGHCGRIGGAWWNGQRTRTIGTATREHVAHDLMLIPTSSDGWIWDGGAKTNMFVKAVVGWNWAFANELVCQSGSTSGAVCGIKNSSNFTAQTCGNDAYGKRECYSDLIYATKSTTPSRPGDSGGPVFTLASGVNRVIAKGTVTGGAPTGMTYQDFGTAWKDFGIVPLG